MGKRKRSILPYRSLHVSQRRDEARACVRAFLQERQQARTVPSSCATRSVAGFVPSGASA
jgi:hypothetical protein